MPKRGLILRIIPYSDSSRIVKCLVDGEGLRAYFVRIPKKGGGTGHLQTGHFVEFTVTEKTKGIQAFKDSRPDSALGTRFIQPPSYAVWLFTIELLNKSLQEDFDIPGLSETIDKYYTHLSHATINNDPFIPLLLLSTTFGIFNGNNMSINASERTVNGLLSLGITINTGSQSVDFQQVLDVFKNHFGIHAIDSEDLLY